MYIDLSKFPMEFFSKNDIRTYPKELIEEISIKDFDEDDFPNYFYENSYNVVGVHFTRLMEWEIRDIEQRGLHSDNFADYSKKIDQLPTEFDEFKFQLKQFVKSNKRSHNMIYFDIGRVNLYHGNTVFLRNWGGESLYCFYDNQFRDKTAEKVALGQSLRKISIPCIVIVRVNAYDFFINYYDIQGLTESIKTGQVKNYSNEARINRENVSVVGVVPIKEVGNIYRHSIT